MAAGSAACTFIRVRSASAAAPQEHAERDALLGRYEALRLQMAAEATTLPLDYSKLADLIRLAGRVSRWCASASMNCPA
jgi:hypothetical protein